MRNKVCWVLVLSLVVSGIGQVVLGDGFRNPPESASALGMIGARYVLVDDVSAVVLNPANLADLEQPEAGASLAVGYAKRRFTPALTGIEEETEKPWSGLPGLYAATPVSQGKYVVGVGINVPFGRFSEYDENASFTMVPPGVDPMLSAPYYASLYVLNINPVVAMRASDNLAVAVGVSAYASQFDMKQAGGIRYETDGVGYGANASLTWVPTAGHTVALAYRSSFDIEYDGDVVVGPTAADLDTEINFPSIAGAAYGIRLSDALRVEACVEWVEHSRNEAAEIEVNEVASGVIPQNWNDNWTYGIGMDWAFAEGWTARAGYIYLETPTPSSTTMPVSSENDQSAVSFGFSYAQAGHSLDFAYAFGIFDERTVSDNVNPMANGVYDWESQMLSIGYSCTF